MDMNVVNIIGRLAKPPTRIPKGGALFIVAVNRPRATPPADFIPCSAWGDAAITVLKLVKGDEVAISGNLRSFWSTTLQRYVQEVKVETIEHIRSPLRKENTSEPAQVIAFLEE